MSIFFTHAPLHDGAVIIRGDRIVAAHCLFPLSDEVAESEQFGTRHRAALGISEVSDAVAIVVSEESGTISVAISGQLTRNLDEGRLRMILTGALFSHGSADDQGAATATDTLDKAVESELDEHQGERPLETDTAKRA